jgi:hypothetical protein
MNKLGQIQRRLGTFFYLLQTVRAEMKSIQSIGFISGDHALSPALHRPGGAIWLRLSYGLTRTGRIASPAVTLAELSAWGADFSCGSCVSRPIHNCCAFHPV